ncbi:Uu.00g102290.m01.CDS01 [Anthostomella pinea]|uniref:Uu.00g102290.m01.CDS01 n=1 Tax=Anthostomella pinea TaxID=933095 RepID=A0AAI8VDD8_9PEZI|nr:Uu.00g102290.m01.CDS01 [Anthostomella pinea]
MATSLSTPEANVASAGNETADAPTLIKKEQTAKPDITEAPTTAHPQVSNVDEKPATSEKTAGNTPSSKETTAASAAATSHEETKSASTTPVPAAVASSTANDDTVNPPDFQGEVQTDNHLPSVQTLRKIEDYTVLDNDGKSHTFKSLYASHNVARRVLIIFIRHFFCGNCQEYLRTLSASITPDNLLQLPVSTFIAVVGCGSHELINTYIQETNCPFPVYADPTRRLYNELGMVRTLAMGAKPAYLQDRSVAHTVLSGIRQGLKQVKSGLVTKMGDQRQVGGEFLFEPATLAIDTPISTPQDESDNKFDLSIEDDKSNYEGSVKGEEKRITWCHRMRNTRDHCEVPELMEVLGLEGDGTPIKAGKRWQRALKQRKGTGLSMASQMGRMGLDAKGLNGGTKNGAKA